MVNAKICEQTLGFDKLKNKSSVQQILLWGFTAYAGTLY